MNPVFLSDSVFLHFGTSSATTGAATNADSTPTVTIAEDGVDMGYVPSVTNIATGLYMVTIAATSGNGFEAGKRYSAYVAATVGGIAGRDGLDEFEVLAVDLNTGVASVTGAVASVTGLTAANLDVAVSTRMATYTQPTGFLAATFPADIASTTNITAGTITTVGTVTTVTGLTAANLDVAVSTRLATAGYTAPLDAAGTRSALGLAAADLDAQLAALPTAAEVVDEVVEGAVTVRQSLRLANAANAGKASGMATTSVVLRDLADTKDRVAATVDSSGNRTAVTTDLT